MVIQSKILTLVFETHPLPTLTNLFYIFHYIPAVMELCGGELKELSSLDLMERNDIVSDESDSMDNIDMNDSYDNDYDWGKEDSV